MEPEKEITYGLCTLGLKRGRFQFLYGDEAFAKITGYDKGEASEGKIDIDQLVELKERRFFLREAYRPLIRRGAVCVEIRIQRKNRQMIYVRSFLSLNREQAGGEAYVQVLIQDVTLEQALEKRLKAQVQQDSMTHLYNKAAIEREVNQSLQHTEKHNQAFYLIDIDNFKTVNDTFGHMFGDTVIQDVAKTLRQVFPPRAMLGRIGGDEFVVFLPETTQEEADRLAKAVEKKIQHEYVTEAENVRISGSIGAVMRQQEEDYRKLAEKADAAMYYAKKSGKGRVAFYRSFMKTSGRQITPEGRREQPYDFELVFYAYNLLTDSRQLDTSMNLLMDRIVDRYGLGSTAVFEYMKEENCYHKTNAASPREGCEPYLSQENLDVKWVEQGLDDQGNFVVNHVTGDVGTISQPLHKSMSKAFVICDISDKGTKRGCVCFSTFSGRRVWSPYEVQTFHELSRAIGVFVMLRREKRRNRERIYRMATRDKVTGLLEQKSFEQELSGYILRRDDYQCLALSYVDIKNFSYINERYGCEAGDDVLYSFARLMKSNPRTLLAGRVFSDCFLGLHTSESRDALLKEIEEAHGAMEQILRRRYPITSIQFKCGIYFLEEEGCCVEEAIENANLARKSVREEAGAGICVYTPKMREIRMQEQELVVEFLDAVKEDRLGICLQPSFRVETKKLAGIEVFGYWENTRGVVRRPRDFVPVLEKYGYMAELDLTVCERLLQTLRRWHDAGLEIPRAGINCSLADFQYKDFIPRVETMVRSYEISPANLVIEMPEHEVRKMPQKAFDVMKQLQERGFKTAVDNFGNNFSSAEMITAEFVDMIKFRSHMLYGEKQQILRRDYMKYVGSLAQMAQKEVIFVGMETREQEQELLACGYETAQGYFYEAAISVEKFEQEYLT